VRSAALILALALAAPMAVGAAEPASHLDGKATVVVVPGERAILKLAPDGGLTLVAVKAARASDVLPPKPGRPKGPKEGNPLVATPEGTIEVNLVQVGDDTLLKIENGTSQAFDYQAAILNGASGRETTSVCTALPLLASYEQWPNRHVTALALSSFKPRATNEVVCPGRAAAAGVPGTAARAATPPDR
jgi:hypothetical protein